MTVELKAAVIIKKLRRLRDQDIDGEQGEYWGDWGDHIEDWLGGGWGDQGEYWGGRDLKKKTEEAEVIKEKTEEAEGIKEKTEEAEVIKEKTEETEVIKDKTV